MLPQTRRQVAKKRSAVANLTLNLELVASEDGREVAELGDADDRDGLEGKNHLVGDAVLFPERRLVLQVAEGGIVV